MNIELDPETKIMNDSNSNLDKENVLQKNKEQNFIENPDIVTEELSTDIFKQNRKESIQNSLWLAIMAFLVVALGYYILFI